MATSRSRRSARDWIATLRRRDSGRRPGRSAHWRLPRTRLGGAVPERSGSGRLHGLSKLHGPGGLHGPQLSGTNLERAGDHNQRVTLQAIRVNGPITRNDLADITGLTPPAIANITRRLLKDNLIREAGQRRGGRGQPATKLVINPDGCFSVGINVDRDHITVVVVEIG